MTSNPAVPRGAVFGPEFATTSGVFRAGTAFAVFVPEVNAPVLLTCQHLFGPAGGLAEDVPADRMPTFTQAVRLWDKWDEALIGRAGSAVALPDADWSLPNSDVAAFVLQPQPELSVLRFMERSLEKSERVFLAARIREGAPRGERLHAAQSMGKAIGDGTEWISFESQKLALAGSSGAPVLAGSGEVVGMIVRFEEDPLVARIVTAQRLRDMIGAVLRAR